MRETGDYAVMHRFFVVRLNGSLPIEDACDYWAKRHSTVFLRTPSLLGYVQNQPVPATEWVCAEYLFESRESERTALSGHYYKTIVADDEAVFLNRESALHAEVVSVHASGRHGRYRTLIFGDAVPTNLDDVVGKQIYVLNRPLGCVSPSPVVTSWWTDSRDVARSMTMDCDTAFVTEPRMLRVGSAESWAWFGRTGD